MSLAITGVLWTRWSFVITPVNYNLALVNAALAATGIYHISRKMIYDPFGTDLPPVVVDLNSSNNKDN